MADRSARHEETPAGHPQPGGAAASAAVSGAPYSVLLVDDQPAFLDLARSILHDAPDIRVAGQATTAQEAVRLVQSLQPDAAIIDVIMPGMSGFKVAQQLREVAPGLKMILTSAEDNPLYARLARTAGAAGFLSKKHFSSPAILALLAAA
jgi:DNA-binding NarL/FixJ family response regulator